MVYMSRLIEEAFDEFYSELRRNKPEEVVIDLPGENLARDRK